MKILTVVGARPQFVKAAVVTRALRARPHVKEIMVHTGQHFDAGMSDIFFEQLDIGAPDHMLGVSGGGHGQMTGRMMERLEQTVVEEKPDILLTYGDTNSTLASALVAAKLHIPIAHVEAGLRSFNREMPEEINRIVTDHVSTWLLCPTMTAVHNLGLEGVKNGVHHVGDTMYDASLHALKIAQRDSRLVEDLGLTPGGFALATVHRAENTATKERLKSVVDYIEQISADTDVVLPLHPGTKRKLSEHGLDFSRVRLIDPVGPFDMAALLDACSFVLTDSGGVQKEAYFFGKRCVTIRDETEWVETISNGWNRLWTSTEYQCEPRKILDYGDGEAGKAVLDAIGV